MCCVLFIIGSFQNNILTIEPIDFTSSLQRQPSGSVPFYKYPCIICSVYFYEFSACNIIVQVQCKVGTYFHRIPFDFQDIDFLCFYISNFQMENNIIIFIVNFCSAVGRWRIGGERPTSIFFYGTQCVLPFKRSGTTPCLRTAVTVRGASFAVTYTISRLPTCVCCTTKADAAGPPGGWSVGKNGVIYARENVTSTSRKADLTIRGTHSPPPRTSSADYLPPPPPSSSGSPRVAPRVTLTMVMSSVGVRNLT